jgi:hypothetical protein
LITDESGAPVDACVAVATVDGDYVGQDSAGADGTYRVGGLLTGFYKLQIWDCLEDTLVVEYYRDHPDLDSADPVAVEGGRDTTGIDVTVARRACAPPCRPEARAAGVTVAPQRESAARSDATEGRR